MRSDKESSSRVLKIFVASFLNTGIVLILVNLRPRAPTLKIGIFNGDYYDFTPEWYQDVGVTILITMLADLFIDFTFMASGILRILWK